MKTVRVLVLVAMGVSAFCGFAQDGAPGAIAMAGGAVVLNRTKAASAKQEIIPADKYPFAAIQKALEKGPGADIESAAASVGLGARVPPGWEPSRDVTLSETAREAVALSAKLSNEQNSPVPGPDGRVVYTFGVGQPTLVATPLRVSSIELQAGEKILGEPQIGDSVRWVVTPISSGTGDTATPILVVKPKMTGLDTTMIVATDRRTYYLRLVSKPGEYVSRVAFLYPDDQPLRWKLFLEQQEKEHRNRVESSRILKEWRPMQGAPQTSGGRRCTRTILKRAQQELRFRVERIPSRDWELWDSLAAKCPYAHRKTARTLSLRSTTQSGICCSRACDSPADGVQGLQPAMLLVVWFSSRETGSIH